MTRALSSPLSSHGEVRHFDVISTLNGVPGRSGIPSTRGRLGHETVGDTVDRQATSARDGGG